MQRRVLFRRRRLRAKVTLNQERTYHWESSHRNPKRKRSPNHHRSTPMQTLRPGSNEPDCALYAKTKRQILQLSIAGASLIPSYLFLTDLAWRTATLILFFRTIFSLALWSCRNSHLALCMACSDLVMQTTRECPLCRTRIVTPARLLRIYRT